MTRSSDLHLPKKCVRCYTSNKPWVTYYFRQLIRQRQRAFLSDNLIIYRMLRNKVIRTAKSIRNSYYMGQLTVILAVAEAYQSSHRLRQSFLQPACNGKFIVRW